MTRVERCAAGTPASGIFPEHGAAIVQTRDTDRCSEVAPSKNRVSIKMVVQPETRSAAVIFPIWSGGLAGRCIAARAEHEDRLAVPFSRDPLEKAVVPREFVRNDTPVTSSGSQGGTAGCRGSKGWKEWEFPWILKAGQFCRARSRRRNGLKLVDEARPRT